MRHDPRWICGLALLIAAPAHALTWGPTFAAGAVISPPQARDSVTIQRQLGPVAQIGLETGRVATNQIMVQLSATGGGIDYGAQPLDGHVGLRTLALGDELHWDFFGKKGWNNLSPQLGFGFLAGTVHLDAQASSDDEGIQSELEVHGLADQSTDSFYLEFHAMAGLRYRVNPNLGVHAEAAISTYGGFLGTWMPKIGVDYLIPKPSQKQKK